MRLRKQSHETWRAALEAKALATGRSRVEVADMLAALAILECIDGEDSAAWLVAAKYGLLETTERLGMRRLRALSWH